MCPTSSEYIVQGNALSCTPSTCLLQAHALSCNASDPRPQWIRSQSLCTIMYPMLSDFPLETHALPCTPSPANSFSKLMHHPAPRPQWMSFPRTCTIMYPILNEFLLQAHALSCTPPSGKSLCKLRQQTFVAPLVNTFCKLMCYHVLHTQWIPLASSHTIVCPTP